MAFFRSEPNLPVNEKARIEFHLQQLAECIGFERFQLPILKMESLLELREAPIEQMVGYVGEYLMHDTAGLSVAVVPEAPEKCGGGG